MPCQPLPPSINPLSPVPAQTNGGRMGQERQTCCDSYSFNEFPELSIVNDIADQGCAATATASGKNIRP